MPPLELQYPTGKTYQYGTWDADTDITLTNVPWSNSYKDVVKFANGHVGLDAYIDSHAPGNFAVQDLTYAKANTAIRLGHPFNVVNRYNYIRVVNGAMPVASGDIQKNFYYFVTNVVYEGPETTIITVELDVVQTFGYDVQIGSAFIERGHIGIANANAFNDFGREYLTQPEGINVGAEYRVIATATETVMHPHPGYLPAETNSGNDDDYGYDILIAATQSLPLSGGTVEAPVLKTAGPNLFQGMPSGAEFWVIKGGQYFIEFVKTLKDIPWVAESIIAIKVIPKITRYIPDFFYGSIETEPLYRFPPKSKLPDCKFYQEACF